MDPFTAQGVKGIVAKEIIKHHGVPTSIVSDCNKLFTGIFLRELLKLYETPLSLSLSYHSQADGQSKVVNHCLEMYRYCFVSEAPKTWSKWLQWDELSSNTANHSLIGMSPFKVVYRRDPPFMLRSGSPSSLLQKVDELLN